MNNPQDGDKAQIISVIDRFYEIISGNSTSERNWADFTALFSKNASLSTVSGNGELRTLNVQDYVDVLGGFLKKNDFWERGSCKQITISGHIAYVDSTYEASLESDFQTTMQRGTNLIQLASIDGKWQIVSMLWEDIVD
ncbi:MAG: hypothetical protein JSU65_02865 [Candidatus Zixiibacteriota bacterium]|nr:MAG: hypothetical protein JSU65_02865 [candidate division Zixibacteria bacterium]